MQILKLIAEQDIETQNQMMEALHQRGVKSTQATLSRDIKELRLIKIADSDDKYRYALPGRENNSDIRLRYAAVLTHAVITIQCAANLVVVKTIPGSAQGCAMAIETLDFDGIVGVIAGDDTLFVAMNNEKEAKSLSEKLLTVVN
jgi:transcriptional regulator of arginine metabolism